MSDASSEPSVDELVRRSLAGEPDAFAKLVAKHQRLVYAVVLSNARDSAYADEVAQEAFVEAWRDLPRLRDPARFSSWLAGIARNVARSWRRHIVRRRRRETLARAVVERTEPTPLDHALERETSILLHNALAQIPSAYREALVLYYVDGTSVEDVARGLGITEDLAKQRLSRGRRALRGVLDARIEDALSELRPGKGFTTTVMVAVSATAAHKANATSLSGKVWLAMNATKTIAVAGAVVLAVCITWYLHSTASTAAHISTPGTSISDASRSTLPRAMTDHVQRPTVHKLTSHEQWQPLVEAIRAASQRREKSSTPLRARDANEPIVSADDDPDQTYVRDAMSGLVPAIHDCYEQARARKPDLAGTLVVHFVIEGEPDIGGVVTSSSIDTEKSGITDTELGQCIEQTMFALEIDPPTAGMKVDVTFPFTFGAKH